MFDHFLGPSLALRDIVLFGQCPGLTRLNILKTIPSQNRQQRKRCEPKQRMMAQGKLKEGIPSRKGRPLVQTLSHISKAGAARSRRSSWGPWVRAPLSQKSHLFVFGTNLSWPPASYLWFVMLCGPQWRDRGRV